MRIKEGTGLFNKIDYSVLMEEKQIFKKEMGEMFIEGNNDDKDGDRNGQEVNTARNLKITLGKSKGAITMIEK